MAFSPMNVSQTMTAIIRRRPVLEQVLRAFEPLLDARADLAEDLAETMASVEAPQFQRERSLAGVPALAEMDVAGMGPAIRQAAAAMLPLVAHHPVGLENRKNLDRLFLDQAKDKYLEQLLGAILAGAEKTIAKIAVEHDLPPQVLNFVAEFVYSPVLRALAKKYALDGATPWDAEEIWSQGYCPVCGSYPSIGWLDRPHMEEKNAFLAGGGGKKHLHCPMCGTGWKFRRLVCPGCGKEGAGTMEILRETGSHGERLDWCTECQSYCPVVDLRELADIPDMDAMAIGMLHMDMAAAQRGLRPLRMSFWNMF